MGQIVPLTMCRKWINFIQSINCFGKISYPQCDLTTPPSIFKDRTAILYEFEEDCDSGELSHLTELLNFEDSLNANVLSMSIWLHRILPQV